MRGLMSKWAGRDAPSPSRAIEEEVRSVAADPNAEQFQAGARRIAQRQEDLSGTLEHITALVEQVQTLGPLVSKLREPLDSEFGAYRRDHADLLAARATVEQLSRLLSSARANEQSLTSALEASEADLLVARADGGQNEKELERAVLDLGATRDALERAESRREGLADELRDATSRLQQVQEDGVLLKAQALQDEERRREVDGLLASASQESLLLEEEAATLRRRLDQSGAELARVQRAEVQAQAQSAAERARATALQAAAERAQAEALSIAGVLDDRTESARAEIAALTARVETATARSAKLESLNGELSQRLGDAVAVQRQAERNAAEARLAAERALERADALERDAAEQKAAQLSLDRARMAAVERGDQLARTLQTHEVAVRRAEERLRTFQAKVEAAAEDQDMVRRLHEEQTAKSDLETKRLQTELAMSAAALEVARGERSVASRGPPVLRATADRPASVLQPV